MNPNETPRPARYGKIHPALRPPVLAMTGLAACAALTLWGCGTEAEAEEEATVAIESPANGSTVTGPEVKLRLSTTHFTFGGSVLEKASAAQHGGVEGGHIHVFLDKPEGLDADAVTTLYSADTTTLTITEPGFHYIIVAGANAGHDDVESMVDSVGFTVAIP